MPMPKALDPNHCIEEQGTRHYPYDMATEAEGRLDNLPRTVFSKRKSQGLN